MGNSDSSTSQDSGQNLKSSLSGVKSTNTSSKASDERGKQFILEQEDCKLKSYYDINDKEKKGTLTNGVGHTGKDVYEGQVITMEKAMQQLDDDYKKNKHYVETYIKEPLTDHQKEAATSLSFNRGAGNFSKSDFTKRINAKEDPNTVAREELHKE